MSFIQLAKSKPNMVCFDMIKPPNRSHTGDPGDYVSRAGWIYIRNNHIHGARRTVDSSGIKI